MLEPIEGFKVATRTPEGRWVREQDARAFAIPQDWLDRAKCPPDLHPVIQAKPESEILHDGFDFPYCIADLDTGFRLTQDCSGSYLAWALIQRQCDFGGDVAYWARYRAGVEIARGWLAEGVAA